MLCSDDDFRLIWMPEVDRQLTARIGVPSSDLPDCCYRDWYDCGMLPEEAVAEVLEQNTIEL